MLFTLLLAALTELFLLRAEHALAKARLAAFEGLLKKCASFLRTTSENSNWPSSVTSSPLMMRGRRLLEDIYSALGISGEEKRKPDKGKKDSGKESSAGRRDGAKAKPRRARHPGAAQKICKADETVDVDAQECPRCRSRHVRRGAAGVLHQVIEIAVKRIVKHFIVWESVCSDCGCHFRAPPPPDARYGFGIEAAALVSFHAALGMTRRKIGEFFRQVCKTDISQGGIQNCLDRASGAAEPHYGAIGRESRRVPVGHVDETGSPTFGPAGRKKHWLWALVSSTLCFFMILDTRSAGAFIQLVGDWAGILVSDGFAVYLKWAGEARQSCLAHLLRKAKKFAEDPVPEIACGGRWILAELDAQLAEAASELRRARAMGGRRSLPRGAGAALRMALRERGAARGRALRKVLTADAQSRRRHFPDSFAEWLEERGQVALADAWRRRGTLLPQQAPALEPEEDAYPRPGL